MAAIFSVFPAQASVDTGWVWVIPVVFVIFLLFGIWTRSQGKGVVTTEKPLASAGTEPRSQPRPRAAAVETPAAAAPARPDDLVIIEGIGPKIAAILSAAGITSFTALAASSPERLTEILKTSGLRVPADPATWPEQAALAAAGRWNDLSQLQSSLKGGRKA